MTNVLIAQIADAPPGRWELVRDAFRQGEGDLIGTPWLLLGLFVLFAVLAVLAVRRNLSDKKVQAKPLRLFHQVADEFGLPWPEQWLLVRIAHHEELPSPLTLMLSSGTLRHHGEKYLDTLPRRKRGKAEALIDKVHRRLFE